MQKFFSRELLILVVGAFAVWLAIDLIDPFPETVDLTLTEEQETTLGELIVDQVAGSDRIQDPKIDAAVAIISERLISHIPDRQLEDFTFHVVNNNDINAFATVGNHIVIFKGLLEMAETPEEVAAVIAHELGHLELNHVSRKLMRELGIGIILGALSGDQGIVVEVTRTLISSSFSRKHEREADQFGLDLMTKSGIDPTSFAAFFKHISNQDSISAYIPAFIASHPSHDERIDAVYEYQSQGAVDIERLPIDWEAVQLALQSY